MKFWELVSIFRSEEDLLQQVLLVPEWAVWLVHYQHFHELVSLQQRDILDTAVPTALASTVAYKSKLRFWIYFERSPAILTSIAPPSENEEVQQMHAAEAWVRFGGSAMEEALEYGSTPVYPVPLYNEVQILNVFTLTGSGTLAYIRTGKLRLEAGDQLMTLNGQHSWEVGSKPTFFLPHKAYLRLQNQEKQSIFQFIIKPLTGQDKPEEGMILRINKQG
jgi:hypothetical protein